jgi:hypothetical protein
VPGAPAALWSSAALVFQPVNATLTAFFSKKLNKSAQCGE